VRRLARAWVASAAVGAAWVADSALACPSCASPLEENRQAFVDTTIFLTVVPLMMIGGLIWWIRRKVRERDEAPAIPVPDTLLRDAGRFQKGR
jgi:hypothetical protein